MISFFCKHFPIFEQMLTKSACLIYKVSLKTPWLIPLMKKSSGWLRLQYVITKPYFWSKVTYLIKFNFDRKGDLSVFWLQNNWLPLLLHRKCATWLQTTIFHLLVICYSNMLLRSSSSYLLYSFYHKMSYLPSLLTIIIFQVS